MVKPAHHCIVLILIACCCFFMVCALPAQTATPAAEEDIRAPRELLSIPEQPKKSLTPWIVGAAMGVLMPLGWLCWRKFRRFRDGPSAVEKALASLAALSRSKESMSAEAFAQGAAAALRQYITDRYGIAAPRRTTEEFLSEIIANEETEIAANVPLLKRFLQACDLAKFAGGQLDRDQREELIQSARGFVAATHLAQPTSKATGA